MDDNEPVEEISDEEKMKIAQFYLMSSPPGQFYEILGDVKKLISSDLLADPAAANIAHNYNVKNNKVVVSPAGNKIPLSASGEAGNNQFLDPVTNALFEVNHLTLTVSEVTSEAGPRGPHEALRSALQAKLNDYLASSYPAELAGVSVYEKDHSIIITITGEKPNLRSYWSGKWSSTWMVQLDTSMISGEIKVHAHYFEDGNFQLQTSKKIASEAVVTSSPEEFATSVAAIIKKLEVELQSGLEDMYRNMNEETIRAMRRVMPITKTKMDWNVNAVRMVRQMLQHVSVAMHGVRAAMFGVMKNRLTTNDVPNSEPLLVLYVSQLELPIPNQFHRIGSSRYTSNVSLAVARSTRSQVGPAIAVLS